MQKVLEKMPDLTQVAVLHNMQKKLPFGTMNKHLCLQEQCVSCCKLSQITYTPLPNWPTPPTSQNDVAFETYHDCTSTQTLSLPTTTIFFLCHCIVKSFRMFTVGFEGHIERGSLGEPL